MSSSNKPSKITPSELVLSTIFFLQQKGGITVKDITKFICEKRGCKQSHVKHEVKKALEKATENGIFSKKRGLYKIESGFGKNKISVRINGRSKSKKVKKGDSTMTRTSQLTMNTYNGGEYDTENIPSFTDNNYPVKKQHNTSDIYMGEPMVFNSTRGNRVSIERIKQAIMGGEDDDDEDFFEDDETEEDEDMDFFSDDENMNNFEHKPEPSNFVQEEMKEPEVEKRKPKLTRKNAKYKSKSKSRSKGKKRKVSKPRKKVIKRKRAVTCRTHKKAEKERVPENTNDNNQEDVKASKEKNPKLELEPDQQRDTNKHPNFIELNDEEMTEEEEPDDLNSVLYSRNEEGYDSDGYISPNEDILMQNLISRDGTAVEKSEDSQDSEKSKTEGSTSEKCTHG